MARALPAERRRVSLARWAAIAAGGVTALALAEASIGVVAPSYDPRGQIHFADIGGVIPIVEPNSVTRQVKNTGEWTSQALKAPTSKSSARNLADR